MKVNASKSALLFVQFSDFLQAIRRKYTKCIFEVLHSRVSQLRVALRGLFYAVRTFRHNIKIEDYLILLTSQLSL
jgi:hypothetical protein